MRVAVTGSSGLIGSALKGALAGAGHEVVPVVRRSAQDGEISWDPDAGTIEGGKLVGVDAVIHLAGAGIGDKRWTDERKRVLVESRTKGTELLATTLARLDAGPRTLISASGIDYYGDRGEEVLTEASGPGSGFLPELCQAWEGAAEPAVAAGIRTTWMRTGVVLTPDGGALARMLLPFKLGIGGRMGTGRQWWSWISIDDEIGAILHLLDNDVAGPVNLTAPEPVRNQEFTKALGRELGRPTVIPIPTFAPKLLFGGELVDTLLVESKRVVPEVLERTGYRFRHRTIEDALAAVLGPQEIA